MSACENNSCPRTIYGLVNSTNLVCLRSVRVHGQPGFAHDVQTWALRGQATALSANRQQPYPVLDYELATVSPRPGTGIGRRFSPRSAHSPIGNEPRLVMHLPRQHHVHTADTDTPGSGVGPCGRLSPLIPLRQPTPRAATA